MAPSRRTHTRRRPTPAPTDAAESPAQASQNKILSAALAEFADRGFDGARVDRIAAVAGVNKAMLYYHFGSKQDLYRAVLHDMLGRLGDTLEAIAARDRPAGDRLAAFIDTFVRMGLSQPRVAPILLREVVEGNVRLDASTVHLIVRLPMAFATIVRDGHAAGAMRPINPLLAYLGLVWPIIVYLASGPARDTIRRHAGIDTSVLEPDTFIAHMQDVCARTLAANPVPKAVRRARPRHTERAS